MPQGEQVRVLPRHEEGGVQGVQDGEVQVRLLVQVQTRLHLHVVTLRGDSGEQNLVNQLFMYFLLFMFVDLRIY